jgi:hypothetical protein
MSKTPLRHYIKPSTKLLRAISRFDWVDPSDVYDALGLPAWIAGIDSRERKAAQSVMGRMVDDGYVERERRSGPIKLGSLYWYRITAAGRRRLAAQLERERRLIAADVATDAEIAEHDAEIARCGRRAA